MLLFFIILVTTALAALILISPLKAPPPSLDAGQRFTALEDQLAGIEKEAASGDMNEAETRSARTEIERRMLALVREQKTAPDPGSRRSRMVLTVLVLTGLSGALVLFLAGI